MGEKGLEPSRLATLAPKASVSTNSTTRPSYSAHLSRFDFSKVKSFDLALEHSFSKSNRNLILFLVMNMNRGYFNLFCGKRLVIIMKTKAKDALDSVQYLARLL